MLRLLLVGPDRDTFSDFAPVLEGHDHVELSWAESGERALDMASDTPFDLIVTDENLGDMAGLELAERIGEPRIIGGCAIYLAKILFSMSHIDAAQEFIHKVEMIDRASYLTPWMTAQMVVWQVRIWLAQGKLDMAAQLAEDRG